MPPGLWCSSPWIQRCMRAMWWVNTKTNILSFSYYFPFKTQNQCTHNPLFFFHNTCTPALLFRPLFVLTICLTSIHCYPLILLAHMPRNTSSLTSFKNCPWHLGLRFCTHNRRWTLTRLALRRVSVGVLGGNANSSSSTMLRRELISLHISVLS